MQKVLIARSTDHLCPGSSFCCAPTATCVSEGCTANPCLTYLPLWVPCQQFIDPRIIFAPEVASVVSLPLHACQRGALYPCHAVLENLHVRAGTSVAHLEPLVLPLDVKHHQLAPGMSLALVKLTLKSRIYPLHNQYELVLPSGYTLYCNGNERYMWQPPDNSTSFNHHFTDCAITPATTNHY